MFYVVVVFFLQLFLHNKKHSLNRSYRIIKYNNFSSMHEKVCEQNVLNDPLFMIILTSLYQMLFFRRVAVNNTSIACVVTNCVAFFTRGKMHVVICPDYSNNYVSCYSIFLYNDLERYN